MLLIHRFLLHCCSGQLNWSVLLEHPSCLVVTTRPYQQPLPWFEREKVLPLNVPLLLNVQTHVALLQRIAELEHLA